MNTSDKSLLGVSVVLLAALLAVAWLTGCASTPYKKGNAAAQSLQTASAELQKEHQSVGTAIEALNELVTNPAPDFRPQFESYNAALNQLHDSIDRAENAVSRSERDNAAHFKNWDKQIAAMSFEVTRERSQARRDAVSNEVTAIHDRYRETHGVALNLVAYLEDIRRALASDLTPSGLDAVKEIAENAGENARKVQAALQALSADMTESGGRMSSTAETSPTSMGAGATPGGEQQAEASGP